MSFAQAMIQSHPQPVIANDALLACIRACFDCAQACTACADACLGEADPKSLARCIRLDLDCADLCDATGRIVSRQTAFEPHMVAAALRRAPYHAGFAAMNASDMLSTAWSTVVCALRPAAPVSRPVTRSLVNW